MTFCTFIHILYYSDLSLNLLSGWEHVVCTKCNDLTAIPESLFEMTHDVNCGEHLHIFFEIIKKKVVGMDVHLIKIKNAH